MVALTLDLMDMIVVSRFGLPKRAVTPTRTDQFEQDIRCITFARKHVVVIGGLRDGRGLSAVCNEEPLTTE
jgi:hypothetical protein